MSEAEVSPQLGTAVDKVVLLYDHSKHLLSLALVGVGGVVSLSQSPLGQGIPGLVIAVLLVALAASGLCSLTCSAHILRARRKDLAVGPTAWLSSQLAMMFLGMGVGGFIVVWMKEIL